MRLITGIYLIISLFLCVAVIPLEAGEEVSIAELISHTQKYDGQRVAIKGEVIGDIINGQAGFAGKSAAQKGADYVWVNVCEQNNIAIGVFCPQKLARQITYRGSYNAAGDQVLAQGVFHRACIAHNSEVDIHAENIIVVQRGGLVAHPVELHRVRLSKNLASMAIVLAIVHLVYYRRKQNKKSRGDSR